MELTENMIEFISGQHFVTVTFSNRKHINRVKKIHETRASEFKFFMENEDGSICAKFPLRWVRINPGADPSSDKPKREMTDEHKQKLLEALARGRASRAQNR